METSGLQTCSHACTACKECSNIAFTQNKCLVLSLTKQIKLRLRRSWRGIVALAEIWKWSQLVTRFTVYGQKQDFFKPTWWNAQTFPTGTSFISTIYVYEMFDNSPASYSDGKLSASWRSGHRRYVGHGADCEGLCLSTTPGHSSSPVDGEWKAWHWKRVLCNYWGFGKHILCENSCHILRKNRREKEKERERENEVLSLPQWRNQSIFVKSWGRIRDRVRG